MTRKKKLINFGVSPILTINKVREKRSNVAQNLRRTCSFNHKAVPTIVGRLGKKYCCTTRAPYVIPSIAIAVILFCITRLMSKTEAN